MTLSPTLILAAFSALVSVVLAAALRRTLAAHKRLQRELKAFSAKKHELEIANAGLTARLDGVSQLEADKAQYREESASLRNALHETRAALKAAEADFAARREELTKAEARLKEQFQAVAGEVLGKNSENFLQLVTQRFEKHDQKAAGDLDARKKAVEELVKPISERLGEMKTQIDVIEKDRVTTASAISEQIRAVAESQTGLKQETSRLVQALRKPKTRGRWGEFQLKNVLEMAGMSQHADFIEQASLAGEDGRLIPDLVVKMPGGKKIVVDAKTPLDAYLDAVDAEDEGQRAAHMARHAKQLREHVKNLSSKQYWAALGDAPDFVVMFLPGEAIYASALDADGELFESAIRSRVLISTPTTFIALVRSIAYGWSQEKLKENARLIAETATDLYGRLAKFGEHLEKMGQNLRRAVESYNGALGSLEARVLPSARRIQELGAGRPDAELPLLPQIDVEPKALSAPEFAKESGA
jgi:DNA recombination protein RmuC